MRLAEYRWLLQLQCNENYRTNVGFTEYDGIDTWLTVQIFDLNGTLLGAENYAVPANQNLQVNDIFQTLAVPCGYIGAYARVQVLNGGSIYAYASVVDNRTGDAIFIPGME